MNVFETVESEVRSYCRGWPVTFDRASGTWLYDEDGNAYISAVFSSVANELTTPFAGGEPRPSYLANRDATPLRR